MPESRTNASVVWIASVDLAHWHYSIPGTLFVLFVEKKKKTKNKQKNNVF